MEQISLYHSATVTVVTDQTTASKNSDGSRASVGYRTLCPRRLSPACALVLLLAQPVWAIEVDSYMELQPRFAAVPAKHILPTGTKELWLDALRQPEAQLTIEVAQSVVRAHRLGVLELAEFSAPLQRALADEQASQAERLAVASALVALDASQCAPRCNDLVSRGDVDLAEIVEPALARWGYEPARGRWSATLHDAKASKRLRLLAMDGLATVGAVEAIEPLRRIVLEPKTSADMRLAAARALGRIAMTRLEGDAQQLTASADGTSVVARLSAAALLERHESAAARSLLAQLASDEEPAVVAAALRGLMRLENLDGQLHLDNLLENRDATVRLLGIECVAHGKLSPDVVPLVRALADMHPKVRAAAADALVLLAQQPDSRPVVGREIVELLSSPSEMAREQAALVAGAIGHKSAANRLVQLLESQPHGVSVAAAWALCRLAAPETGEAIHAALERDVSRTAKFVTELAPAYARHEKPSVDLRQFEPTYEVLEHLILALGRMRHRPADSLLRNFVPKPVPAPDGPPRLEVTSQPRLRAAAIWSLGQIHAGSSPADVIAPIIDRLNDTTPIPAESSLVRRMATVSLATMGAKSAIAALREHYEPSADAAHLGRYCGWAIEQLTGERLEQPSIQVIQHANWFLEPLGK